MMLTSEVLDTIDAALYFLRASDRTEMHGNQLERIDAALAAVQAERGQGVARLDFPDSVGHWAFETDHQGYTRQEIIHVTDYIPYLNSAYPVPAIRLNGSTTPSYIPRGTDHYIGAWTRLHMPWESPAEPTPQATEATLIVLSREYEDGDPWEFEPLPSSRDDEYLRRCRYDTKEEALEHWNKWLKLRRGQNRGD